MSVRELSPPDREAWDAFVRAHPRGTFMHLSGWARVIGQGAGHRCRYLMATRNGEIAAVLPLAEVRSRLFGHALVSTPFCVYGGVLAQDPEAAAELVAAAADLADRLGVDHLELRNREPVAGDWPGKDLYVTFRKQISADHEENMLAIPRKQRAMVRKGIKAGLQAEVDTGLERFYRIYAESVRNHGTPVFSRRYFRALYETFGDDIEVSTVTHEGRPVSTVLTFFFRDEVLPYYGGGLPAARRLKAFDFMYWEVMKRAVDRGCRIFDYGRSKKGTGSFSFKKNWGFEPAPLDYRYHLVRARSVPELNPLNPKYRLFIRAWQRLPLVVANAVGPWLARNLG